MSVTLIESRFAERGAIKAAPKKSAFDGPINKAATADIANEILNDMQRDRGGDKVLENQSRYQVTLRRTGGDAPDWTGEVVGAPGLHVLKTVNVLAAGKSVTVFDKNNRKLWERKLNYEVPERPGFADEWSYGQGPCVEHGDALFIFDQGVLTAFDRATGNVRWRLPSVGVAGLFFDDQGMIYVNTTSASQESIKYSRQIDISEKTSQMVLKVDPKTGKQLWGVRSEGMVGYVSGKFIYTTETYHADEDDKDSAFGVKTGLEVPSHVRIKRLAAGNGKVLWEHYQMRAPLDVQFDQNSIQLLFKKEMQVLKFLAL
jgi:outer membrane protein assembly factor BamB